MSMPPRTSLTTSQARAWLVDYTATLLRDADLLARDGNPDKAHALRQVSNDLAGMLRRWEPSAPPHR